MVNPRKWKGRRPKGRQVPISTINVNGETHRLIRVEAQRLGLSMQAVMEMVIERAIGESSRGQ